MGEGGKEGLGLSPIRCRCCLAEVLMKLAGLWQRKAPSHKRTNMFLAFSLLLSFTQTLEYIMHQMLLSTEDVVMNKVGPSP